MVESNDETAASARRMIASPEDLARRSRDAFYSNDETGKKPLVDDRQPDAARKKSRTDRRC